MDDSVENKKIDRSQSTSDRPSIHRVDKLVVRVSYLIIMVSLVFLLVGIVVASFGSPFYHSRASFAERLTGAGEGPGGLNGIPSLFYVFFILLGLPSAIYHIKRTRLKVLNQKIYLIGIFGPFLISLGFFEVAGR